MVIDAVSVIVYYKVWSVVHYLVAVILCSIYSTSVVVYKVHQVYT